MCVVWSVTIARGGQYLMVPISSLHFQTFSTRGPVLNGTDLIPALSNYARGGRYLMVSIPSLRFQTMHEGVNT